jgi:hypothetical protein
VIGQAGQLRLRRAEQALEVWIVTTVLISLLTLIGGALVSGVLTYLGSRSKLAMDYDADLRKRRIETYSDLWSKLEPLAKYAPKETFSEADAVSLAKSLRDWYFEKGGLFLSTAAREDCFALQDLLKHISEGWGWERPNAVAESRDARFVQVFRAENLSSDLRLLLGGWIHRLLVVGHIPDRARFCPGGAERSVRGNLTPAAREQLRTYGSRLRTSLIADVGTRSRPKIRGDVERVDRSLEGVYERDDGQRLKLGFRPWMLGGTRRRPIAAIENDGPRSVKVLEWNRGTLTIRALLNDPQGKPHERILLIERGQLVEGPTRDEEAPAQPALWKRIK